MSDTCCRHSVRGSPSLCHQLCSFHLESTKLWRVPVQESLSAAAASGAHLTVNLQPLVHKDTTLMVSSGPGGLGEDCVGCFVFWMRHFPAKHVVQSLFQATWCHLHPQSTEDANDINGCDNSKWTTDLTLKGADLWTRKRVATLFPSADIPNVTFTSPSASLWLNYSFLSSLGNVSGGNVNSWGQLGSQCRTSPSRKPGTGKEPWIPTSHSRQQLPEQCVYFQFSFFCVSRSAAIAVRGNQCHWPNR